MELHVVEKHNVGNKEVWADQVVDKSGSKSVDSINYNEGNTIHIVNKGHLHFEPALKIQKIQYSESRSDNDSDEERTKNAELFDAIRKGNLDKIRSFLEDGVKTDIIDKNNKSNSPLHYAVERGKKEIVEELLNQKWKTNINFQNEQGNTPLHVAVLKGKSKVVELLLEKGAKINIVNGNNEVPLDVAEHLGRQDIILQLSGSAIKRQNTGENKQAPNRKICQTRKKLQNLSFQ